MDKVFDRVKEAIEGLCSSDAVSLWNRYVEEDNRWDDEIYSMDEFDELMSSSSPIEVASRVCYGDFNPSHDWFWYNGCGNLESSSYPESDHNSPFCLSEIARWIVDNEDALGNDDIEEALEEEEEEEDEEEDEEE